MSVFGTKRTFRRCRIVSLGAKRIDAAVTYSIFIKSFADPHRIFMSRWLIWEELEVAAMQRWESDFSGGVDEPDLPLPDTPEQRVDRFGMMTAVFAVVVASFIAAIWFLSRPSFEKCSALENVEQRNACYDPLRDNLSKAPAKGANIPKL
jgi:hypothetical protein